MEGSFPSIIYYLFMKKVSILAVLIIFISCDKSSEFNQSSISNHISQSEAIHSLETFMNSTGLPTKTTISQYTIEPYSYKTLTKSIESPTDTVFYLVNFNEGFSVLSAKRSLRMPIICFSEKGHFTKEDLDKSLSLISNGRKGLYSFNAEDDLLPYLLYPLIGSEDDDDTEFPIEWDPDPIDPGPTSGSISRISYLPFLKTKWHQQGVFDDLTPNNYPAGCVAIAIGQIVVKNRFSNTLTFDGKLCDLDTLETVHYYSDPDYPGSQEAHTQAAKFIKVIGDSNHCNIQYGPEFSGSCAAYAKQALENLGYDNVTIYSSNNITTSLKNTIISSLQNGYPVYFDGCLTNSYYGHAWVIDGYLHEFYDDGQQVEVFHINWGWNGSRDGYFNIGIFNPSNRRGKGHIDTYCTDNSNSYNFTWFYNLISYTHD